MYLFGYIFAHVHLQKYKFQLEILDSIFIFFLVKSILNTFHTTIQFSKLKKTNLSHIVSVQCKINWFVAVQTKVWIIATSTGHIKKNILISKYFKSADVHQ